MPILWSAHKLWGRSLGIAPQDSTHTHRIPFVVSQLNSFLVPELPVGHLEGGSRHEWPLEWGVRNGLPRVRCVGERLLDQSGEVVPAGAAIRIVDLTHSENVLVARDLDFEAGNGLHGLRLGGVS